MLPYDDIQHPSSYQGGILPKKLSFGRRLGVVDLLDIMARNVDFVVLETSPAHNRF
jgi:hypothetical protein